VADALASWNDTPPRQAIVEFVENAARDISPEERVATFDDDGAKLVGDAITGFSA
jgi:hypothetical protein